MKKILFPLLSVVFMTISSYTQTNDKMNDIKGIIEKIRLEYAPDKRVALFNLQAEEIGQETVISGETNIPEAAASLKKELQAHNILYTSKITMLPDAEGLKGKTCGIIKHSVANIRTNPAQSAEMATQSLLGTRVNVLKASHGWYLIQTPDRYIAWAEDDAVELMTDKEAEQWNNSRRMIYTSEYGFSYAAPDEKSQHVADLVMGNLLKYAGEEKGFIKVEYPDKRTAYIPAGLMKDFKDYLGGLAITADDLIRTAKIMMGIPYLWGGTSLKAVDCSGFTKTIYFMNGVLLARDASQQVHTGDLVDTQNGFDKLQPGDLLFFGTKATPDTKEKVTHVAMYIGNGEYIHSAGHVKINSLDRTKENFSEYRYNSFIRAKRMLTSINKNGVYLLRDHNSYFEASK